MKQTKLWLATMAMLLCCVTASAHDFEVGGIYYNITSSTDLTVEVIYAGKNSGTYSGEYYGTITIPEIVAYGDKTYRVTSIGSATFYGCNNLTSISIPMSIVSIDEYAFCNCRSLTSIIVAAGNTFYDSRNKCNAIIETSSNTLIAGCSTTIIPESVTSIGEYAFHLCHNLTSVTIPEGVTSIGEYAFNDCSSLTSITIPKSMTSIKGIYTFKGCDNLYRIINYSNLSLTKGVSNYGYIAYNAKIILNGNTMSTVGNFQFHTSNNTHYLVNYIGKDNEIVLPYNYNGKDYKIEDYTFVSCSGLTSITIPESVTSIGNGAFLGCSSLKEVIIENSNETLSLGYNNVYTIGRGLFDDCPLEKVYLGRNLSYSSDKKTYSPFYGLDKLSSIVFGDSVTEIGNNAFYGCGNLTSIIIPKSVTSIGIYAFSHCYRLESITIPENIVSIGYYAFESCSSLYKIINHSDLSLSAGASDYGNIAYNAKIILQGSKLSTIGDFQFYTSDNTFYLANYIGKDTEIVLPDKCNGENYAIGEFVFYGCSSPSSITIPKGATSIGNSAFYGCYDLTSITIPDNVTSIGNFAFNGCRSLKTLIIEDGGTTLSLGNGVDDQGLFYDCPLENVYLGRDLNYSSSGYSPFYKSDRIPTICLGNSVTSIPSYLFYNNTNLATITLSESVTEIGNSAFSGCSSLATITLPESVTEIGNSAFSGCSSLATITLPESVTSIGDYSFDDCTSLKKVVIENSSETLSLGENYCSYDSRITGQGLFYDCPLEKVYLGRNLQYSSSSSSGYSPFYNAERFPTIFLRDSITSIPPYLFYDNKVLSSITIPANVTTIAGSAFKNCDSLSTVYFEDGELKLSLGYSEYDTKYVGKGLFYDCKQLRKVYIGRELDFETDKKYGYSPLYGMNIDTLIISKKQLRDLRLGGINKQATLLYIDNDYSGVIPAGLQKNCTLHYFNAPYNSPDYEDIANYLKNSLSCNAQMVPLGNISVGFYSLEVTLNGTLLKHEVRDRFPVTTGPNKKPILRRYVKINGDTITANATGVYKYENLEMGTGYNVELIYNGYRDNLYIPYTTSATVFTKKIEPTCNVSATLSTATIRYNVGDTIGLGKPISEIGVYYKGTHYPAEGKDKWHDLPYYTTIKDLHPGNSFNYQIYCKIDTNYHYGAWENFNTKSPTISLVENEGSTQTTVNLKVIGEYSDSNISPIEIGVISGYTYYWLYDEKYIADKDGNVFITGLKPDTTYIMTPYVKYKEEDYNMFTGTNKEITTDSITIACNCVATSATTLTVKGTHDAGDATVIEYGIYDHAVNMDQTTLTGLDPNSAYTFTYYVTTAEGGTVTQSVTARTEELAFNTLKAKATSNTRAIICAEANIANEESGTGFEWRRIDAPDLVPSEVVGCAVHDNVMEGTLDNLSASTYYKYRPFYTSASGQSYYGEWVGFGTADAYVYFTPTVHTYATAMTSTNAVRLTGYVLPGSDDIVEQGFEYWKDGASTRSNNVTRVIASGQRMSVLIENLEHGTRYKYRAFATTTKETVYGDTQMFETPVMTDVEEVIFDSTPAVSTGRGVIYINNVDDNCRVRIFTLSGVEVYTGYDREISVEGGIYIVHTDGITQKLMVK